MQKTPSLTDRLALQRNRRRAALSPVSFLHETIADDIKERLTEVNKPFNAPMVVGHIHPASSHILPGAKHIEDNNRLAIEPQQHDLVLHSFGLHWADDPIGQMVQSRLALVPDGLFLGVMFGGATLNELRASLAEAEAQVAGGLSPRILPMADVRDLGGLLQRAGLALPVADARTITVRYPNLKKLAHDLRGMGETNALAQRSKTPTSRKLFETAEDIYRTNFCDDDYLIATFEVIFLTGWAPAETQPQPLRPGSAKTRLSDALGVPENPLKP